MRVRRNTGRTWNWWVGGKHPAVGDFVELGRPSPLSEALNKAVIQAWARLAASGGAPDGLGRWNFWLAGPERDTLACGHLAGSRDRLGRPAPLVLIGYGDFCGWEARWRRLPQAMEPAWRELARLAADSGISLEEFQNGLERLPKPDDEKAGGLPEPADTAAADSPARAANGNDRNGAGFVRVSSMREAFWPGAPKAAFLPAGERETTAYLFRRPVCPADLVGLWTGR